MADSAQSSVITGFQQAINLEWQLALQYHLCNCQLKALGLSVAGQVSKLGAQCQDFVSCLVTRIMFLGGDWGYEPKSVETYPTITAGFETIRDMELAIVTLYQQVCKDAWEANDLNNFHFVQHLVKWHETGGNDRSGHLSWLKQQLRQIDEIGGEKVYIAQTMKHGEIQNS